MKRIVIVYVLVAIVFFSMGRTFASERPKINLYFYSQPYWGYSDKTQGFGISKSRALVNFNLTGKFFCFTEIGIVPTVQLIKAQIQYEFGGQKIIFGQQNNSFKFYNPPPHKRIMFRYPLGGLVPVYDDLGITWQGRITHLNYRLSLLNGEGANQKENNKNKDVVLWMKFSPAKFFSMTGCYQGGWQNFKEKKYYREGEWLQGEITFSRIVLKPTYVRRKDMGKDGWFIVGILQADSKNRLLLQYLKDTNKESELTLGAIVVPGKNIRFLPDIFLRRRITEKYTLGVYLMVQFNVVN